MKETKRYDELIAKEAQHWGAVRHDPQNPQIWHDQGLFDIFFGREYERFVDRACSFGPRVLELGCGEGNLSVELAARGMRVMAIDLSADRIERARKRAEGLNLGVQPTWIVADLNTFSLPESQFDCVVAHDSLHHVLHLDKVCESVRTALVPGGHFVVMDYVGMGVARKLLLGFLYAVLPTYQPYSMKWRLRKRFPGFLASEEKKRKSLEQESEKALHQDSPFEEMSQQSIIREITHRFNVLEKQSFCPFWFYLAAKIRLPLSWKYPVARFFRSFDDLLVRARIARGAYVFIVAQKMTSAK